MNGFLFQFQSAMEEVFDDGMDVFEDGIEKESLEIACIVLRERAGEVSILLKCCDIHEVGLDTRANVSAKLGEDAEAAVIHVRPEKDGNFFGDEFEEAADGGRGVAHEADCCVGSGSCNVLRSVSHGDASRCFVVYLCTCVLIYVLVKGGEVFDAEDGFGADVDSLNVGDLRRGKTHGWSE